MQKKEKKKESKSKAADIVQGVWVDWKPEMPLGFSALQWGGDLPGTFQRLTQRLHFPNSVENKEQQNELLFLSFN